MHIRIQRVDKELPLPKYESTGAVAFDVIVRKTTVIAPKDIVIIPGNVIVEVPKGYALFLAPRSSLPRKKALVMPHSIGIIDQDYCGSGDELGIQVQNISDKSITVERGERIAQGCFVKIEKAEWTEVEDMETKTRGGFGSTDKHNCATSRSSFA